MHLSVVSHRPFSLPLYYNCAAGVQTEGFRGLLLVCAFLFWSGFLICCDQRLKEKQQKKTPSNCRSKTEEKMTLMLKYILMFELLQCLNCHLYFCTVFSYLSLISVICSITLTWFFFPNFHTTLLPSCLFVFHLSLFISLFIVKIW